MLVDAVEKSGLERGVKAGNMIRAAAKVLGGGDGGKAELAQGGGPELKARKCRFIPKDSAILQNFFEAKDSKGLRKPETEARAEEVS